MCNKITKKLTYLGMDSWNRPVYEDEEGRLWKDVDYRKRFLSDRNICSAYMNEFEGEPDCHISEKYQLIFIPERVVRE